MTSTLLASVVGQSPALRNQCAADNPFAFDGSGASLAPAGVIHQKSTREREQSFVRAYLDDVYLWYKEIPSVDAALPAYRQEPYANGMGAYFNALLTQALLPDGQRKDRFSILVPRSDWAVMAQADQSSGWGLLLMEAGTRAAPVLNVAYVDPGSPAAAQGVRRGDRILAMRMPNGEVVDLVTANADAISLLRRSFSQAQVPAGNALGLSLQSAHGGAVRQVRLNSAAYARQPVMESRTLPAAGGTGAVGYIAVKEFMLPTEAPMLEAMTELKAAGVSDLVVDLRYNGGGTVYQAAQLAYMTAGAARTSGKVFQRFEFNDKQQGLENSLGEPLPFLDRSTGVPGSGTTAGEVLPDLGLRRVYVLTTRESCSASESFINGLRGIGVEVVQIGATTCGKPYAQFAVENCGVVHLPVMAKGSNDQGAGDFEAGMVPTCPVPDDLTHELGDVQEAQLAAALHHRQSGTCPAGSTPAAKALPHGQSERTPTLWRHPLSSVGIVNPPARLP
ncbi:MAG: S41 family peptidase [Lautropia sp.]|nr:S41 family peptidase [Lautropia sp.]